MLYFYLNQTILTLFENFGKSNPIVQNLHHTTIEKKAF